MKRLAAAVILVAGVALAAEQPSSLPKDTLPQKINLSAIPLGLENRALPKDNPLIEGRVQLGRRLFFDPILSGDNTVACASCHQPDHGFASAEALPRGIRGQLLSRRAPSLFNRAYGAAFFWDGRAKSLEDQALEPIENPLEMGSTVPAAVDRLQKHKNYKSDFEAEFADGVTSGNLAKALASFERVLLRGDSPVDRFRRKGEHAAMTPAQRHGLWLYESKARCWRCHGGANFSDEGFHNTGVSWGRDPADLGRYVVTKKEADKGKFKTPTLRGVALTAPYMHDGSLKSLEDVVKFYNQGGTANPYLDPIVGPLGLSDDENRGLVEFLKSL